MSSTTPPTGSPNVVVVDPDLEEGLVDNNNGGGSGGTSTIPPEVEVAGATSTDAAAAEEEDQEEDEDAPPDDDDDDESSRLTISGPEVIPDNELPPLPTTIMGGDYDSNTTIMKGGVINLEEYEVKQAAVQKILAPTTTTTETLLPGDNSTTTTNMNTRVSVTDTEAGVAGEDAIEQRRRHPRNNYTSGNRGGNNNSTIRAGGRRPTNPDPDDVTVQMPEAIMVNEGDDDPVVMVATPVDPPLPWWKQPRYRALMFTAILFVAGIITAVAVLSSKNKDPSISGGGGDPASNNNNNVSESGILSPTLAPTPIRDCFADREELKAAVDEYIDTDCGSDQDACNELARKYGWPINAWCVGNVTSLQGLFVFKETFNEDISAWDVSRVTDFSHLFNFSSSFNQNLSSWNTSSATNFSSAFANASSFDNDISTWDTSNVVDFQALFYGARSFNGDVSRWNTSSVRNLYGTFAGAASFDGSLELWDVSKVGSL